MFILTLPLFLFFIYPHPQKAIPDALTGPAKNNKDSFDYNMFTSITSRCSPKIQYEILANLQVHSLIRNVTSIEFNKTEKLQGKLK